jgi:hypothetical protein
MKHVVVVGRPKLIAIMTKHVDDLKLAGIVREIITILQQIENNFGKLKIEWHEFTNCGVRHRQHKVRMEITLDHLEYASSLRIIAHSELVSKKSEDAVTAELHSLYRLLLGAIAFLLVTHADVADHVSVLQQWGHAPNVIHVKRLNDLTKWIHANPKCLVHRTFSARGNLQVETGFHQRVFSDSALNQLKVTDWSGNIRELRNIIESLVILCGQEISGDDVKIFANPKA